VDAKSGIAAAFCGRIDNRTELLSALELVGSSEPLSDGALFLRSYLHWREGVFGRLLGPYSAIVVDERRKSVLCARDPLGDRGLFFHLGPAIFAAASEESALLSLPGVSARLDENSVGRFFAPDEPLPGSTFFAEVSDLQPGEVMEVGVDDVRRWRSAEIVPATVPRYHRDREYVDQFRELLGRAVEARLRAVGPPGVMMSGGLDSTALAAVAAPMIRTRGGRLRSFSYTFSDLPSCDESAFIAHVTGRFDLQASAVVGDRLWPLCNLATLPRSPNNPLQGPYRGLRDAVFSDAATAGTRVLISGEFGDELYCGAVSWLADLLRRGRLPEAIFHCVADRWWRMTGRRPRLYSLLSSLRCALGGKGRWQPSTAQPWLTARGLQALESTEPALPDWGRPAQIWTVLHRSGALSNVSAPYHASSHGIEVRRPYRDRRLIEFILAVPAHLLYRPGQTKWILREALRGELPDEVRLRRHPTSLQALFCRGLMKEAREDASRMLFAADALWRPYVRQEWLEESFPRRLGGPDGPTLSAIWRSLCVELWRQGLGQLGVFPALSYDARGGNA
jgi:asparagine synthase (glutamine-hydrolysing)